MASTGQRYGAVVLHGHAASLSAQRPFQHLNGEALGHDEVHWSSVATQYPPALDVGEVAEDDGGQRIGELVGHGQLLSAVAQERSQHCTVPDGHFAVQFSCFSTHGPLLQRIGRVGGQEHMSMDETHFESQHCTWFDAHCTHWSRDDAHVPEPGQLTGVMSGQAFEQTAGITPPEADVDVPERRQRGASAAQLVLLVMSLHGLLTQEPCVSL